MGLVVSYQYKKHWKLCWAPLGLAGEESGNKTKKDMGVSTAAKHSRDLPTSPDTSEHTPANSRTNASSVSGPSLSPQTYSDMWETFTTKRSPTNVTSVNDVLDNKPIWTDICGNMKTTDRPFLMVWDQEDINFSCLQSKDQPTAGRL